MRYIVFGYDIYYPSAGPDQIQGLYRTIEAARLRVKEISHEWDNVEIYDIEHDDCVE